MNKGVVVWVTGLSGAGKTTISRQLAEKLRMNGRNCVLLDGDELRKVVQGNQSGYDRSSRLENAWRYCRLAKVLADQGVTAILATISLFKEIHDWNRSNFPQYIEIFIDVPLTVLRERDHKGLYSGLEKGLVSEVVGLDLEYDRPRLPDFVFNNQGQLSDTVAFAEMISENIISSY